MASYCTVCGSELPQEGAFCPDDGGAAVERDAFDANSGRLIDQRYRLLERIGQGGVGSVYRAVHVKIRKPAAVKLLRRELTSTPQMRGRFEREARAASRLDHPGCVAVTDFGSCGWELFLAMELLEGRSLVEALDAGLLPPAEAMHIGVQMLDALDHAHQKGVVHRDLKPGNVFLCHAAGPMPRVKLLDFGFAKILAADAGSDPIVTDTGTVFGTPAYMSPEQATAAAVGPASDQYAAGAVLFEMFGGSPPFPGSDAKTLLLKHVTEPPPDVRERNLTLSAELAATLQRALAKRPMERFPDVVAFRQALRDTPEGRAALDTHDTVLELSTVLSSRDLAPLRADATASADAASATAAAGTGQAAAFLPAPRNRTPRGGRRAPGPLSEDDTRLALEEPGMPSRRRRALRRSAIGLGGAAAVGLALGLVFGVGFGGETDPGGAATVAAAAAAAPATAPTGDPTGGPSAWAATDTPPEATPTASSMAPETAAASPAAARARALWLAGDSDAALAAAFAATRVASASGPVTDAQAELLIGHIYFERSWPSDAVGHYRRALDLDPSLRADLRLRTNARTLASAGHPTAAEAAFLAAVLDPPAPGR
jgi:tRNA A-37 threonylcarbamoyl transferase component Bud32